MDWMYFNPDSAAAFGPLGCYVGDKYKLSDEAMKLLESMNESLLTEDKTLRTFRRSLGFSQTIQKDLAPILMEVKKDQKEVFFAAIG